MVERRGLTARLVLLVLLFGRQPPNPAPGVASGTYWTATVEGDLTALTVADPDHDGWVEILGGTDKGRATAWGADGRPLWEFAVETDWVTGLSSADLDGDGRDEVLVTAAGILPTSYLYVLKYDGSLLWSHAVRDELWAALPFNVDDDPGLELLLAARRPRALDNDGTELSGWPAELLRTPFLRLADWDGDGTQDVVTVQSDSLAILEPGGSWHTLPVTIHGEIEALAAGDVDADGLAEAIVLTDSALILIGNQGGVRWTRPARGTEGGLKLVTGYDETLPQCLILVAETSGVRALNVGGRDLWTFDAGLVTEQPFLVDGQRTSLIVGTTTGQAYLLGLNGQVQMEYDTGSPISLVRIADLNGDSHPEVLLAGGGTVSVFGEPVGVVEMRSRWVYLARAPVVAAETSDIDRDGRAEVLLGDRVGHVALLDRSGNLLWRRASWGQLGGLTPDGTGAFLTWAGSDLRRLDGEGRPLWETDTGGSIRAVAALPGRVAVLAEDGDIRLLGSPDGNLLKTIDLASPVRDLAALAAGILITQGDAVSALGLQGEMRWRTSLGLAGPVVVSVQPDGILIRSGGHLSWLEESGAIAWNWSVEPAERLTSAHLGQSLLAVGTDSRVVVLNRQGVPVWSLPLDEVVSAVTVLDFDADGMEEIALGTVKGTVEIRSAAGEVRWQAKGRDRVNVLVAPDMDGDGKSELLAGFEDGVVNAYGLESNQPPWLSRPAYASVGAGYQYTIQVRDPDGDQVQVQLEILDPSSQTWAFQGVAVAPSGEGTLTWNVPSPFDTWDAMQDSAYRFTWMDGHGKGTIASSPGPLQIPVDPWYLTYGRFAGLISLIIAVPVLLFVIVGRTYAHRRSPLGRAEAELLRLTLEPQETLAEINRLLSDANRAKLLLDHLPGLAREAGNPSLGDLLEGVHIAFARADLSGASRTGVLIESMQTITDALRQLTDIPQAEDARAAYSLLTESLEVGSVYEIAKLRLQLAEVGARLQTGDPLLAKAGATLNSLSGIARTLHTLERAESAGDRILHLAEAAADLGQLERETGAVPGGLEVRVATSVISHWLRLVTQALKQLRGRAEIDLGLHTRQLVLRERATLGITLSNRGRSPATDVTAEVVSCDGLLPPTAAAAISVLPPGESERLKIPVRPAGTVGDFEIVFLTKWSDRESPDKEARVVTRLRLAPVPAEFAPIPNPYATGRPLGPGSPVFVGRGDLFDFVKEKLGGGHVVLLIGERRSGKTSFLRQLPSRLQDDSILVYLDAQGLGIEGGMAGWLADAALQIGRVVGSPDIPLADGFQAQPGPAFEAFLQRVADGLPMGRRLLILLDEFEEIESRVRDGDLPAAIFHYLRHLMQFGDAGFMLAGTRRLEELSPEYWAPLLGIGIYREVGPLDEDAARQLIVAPVQGKLLYDDLAVDKLLRLSGRNPYFLQLLCHSVVAHCNKRKLAYITAAELDMPVDEALTMGQAHLRFLWQGVSEESQEALAILARLTADGEPRTAAEISSRLAASGRGTQGPRLLEVLSTMTQRGFLVKSFDDQFRFTADLFRIWVGGERPWIAGAD